MRFIPLNIQYWVISDRIVWMLVMNIFYHIFYCSINTIFLCSWHFIPTIKMRHKCESPLLSFVQHESDKEIKNNFHCCICGFAPCNHHNICSPRWFSCLQTESCHNLLAASKKSDVDVSVSGLQRISSISQSLERAKDKMSQLVTDALGSDDRNERAKRNAIE